MNKLYLRNIVTVTFFMLSAGFANAQISNPVKWTYTAKKITDKTYELHLSATIEGNWHMYAQDAGEGPEPTTINFTANPLITFDGKVKEVGKLEKSYDKNFNSVLKYYGNKVDFVQKIRIKSPVATVVKGTITFMVCNDRQCLPPRDIPFTINVSGK